MSSVMGSFDPEEMGLSKSGRAPRPAGNDLKRITSLNPNTGEVRVEGMEHVAMALYMDMGGHIKIAPVRDNGIDQDPVAHAARRPRSFADAQGIDQIG